jgi:hypothetical protein
MMNDGGKRVFLVVLVLIFGLLLYMCVDGRDIIRWTADVAYSRGNESLYIELLGDGAVFIGGEGKLYGTDMRALIEGESMTIETVTDIIIGNGITEIGYDVICEYPILRTVRFGDGVTVLGNGCISDCPELQFVFIPAGVQRISRNFLYDCNRCIVITDGPAEGLPKLRNTRKANIIGNVDSYATMQSAWQNGTELPEILERWWP